MPILPEKTVRGRIRKPISLAAPPDAPGGEKPYAVAAYDDRLVAAWPQGLGLYDPSDGRLLKFQDCGSASGEDVSTEIKTRFHREGPAIVQADSVLWFYGKTLAERGTASLAGLPKDRVEGEWSCGAFDLTEDGHVLALLVGPSNGNYHAAIGMLGKDGKATAINWLSEEAPIDIVSSPDAILIALSESIFHFPQNGSPEKAMRVDLDGPIDRLWPSPNGRYIISTGDGQAAFRLFESNPQGEPPLSWIYQGMHVPASDDHPGGWVFFDGPNPTIPEPEPLQNPAVAWSADSSIAVLGDEKGLAAIIDPSEPKAVKLMTPPEVSFLPFAMEPPDVIRFLDGDKVSELRLDESLGKEPNEKRTPSNPVCAEGVSKNKTRLYWTLAAMVFAALSIAVWILLSPP